VNKVIEWILADKHFLPGYGLEDVNSIFCATTMILPCFFNVSTLVPLEDFPTSPPFIPKPVSASAIFENLVQNSDGSDGKDVYDLYSDLEFPHIEGTARITGATLQSGRMFGYGGPQVVSTGNAYVNQGPGGMLGGGGG
jgi:hypothetical protein